MDVKSDEYEEIIKKKKCLHLVLIENYYIQESEASRT